VAARPPDRRDAPHADPTDRRGSLGWSRGHRDLAEHPRGRLRQSRA
jgi:hypothetical protein